MGKAGYYTYGNIKELIPQFLGPGKFKARREFRLYRAEREEKEDGEHLTINLYTSTEEDGEYVPRLYVVESSPQDEVTAIYPHVAVEAETGEHYLFYGKDKGGIYTLHLNPRNGLAYIEGHGVCVARRPKWLGEAISQPFVVYNEETRYYYLFVTYGDPNCDANIRVGRSRRITGPYLDPMNRYLTDIDDFKAEHGFMISCGYRFDDEKGYKSCSAPMVYKTEQGQWFFLQEILPYPDEGYGSCNVADKGNSCTGRLLDVRELFWTPDGWPVISPVSYQKDEKAEISPKDIIGRYEFIKFVPMLPQGVFNSVNLTILDQNMRGIFSTRNSWALKIPDLANGRLELGGSIRGYWKLLEQNLIEFYYENYVETYKISSVLDPETGNSCIILTGKDSNGMACFAKQYAKQYTK